MENLKYSANAFLFIFITLTPILGIADILYKEISIGSNCIFNISRFWNEDKVGWGIPGAAQEMIVDYNVSRYSGKEAILDVTYIKSKIKANIDGGIQNTIYQLQNRPRITNFVQSCSVYNIPNGNAKRCQISYKKNNAELFSQLLAYIPTNDPYSTYLFNGTYVNAYNEKVFDKLFSSFVCN